MGPRDHIFTQNFAQRAREEKLRHALALVEAV
jgi:hypothetical protein